MVVLKRQKMDASGQSIFERIEMVRQFASQQLRRLANSSADEGPGQTYLFEDERFCGVRYDLGSFSACWLCGWDHIELFRQQQRIDALPLPDRPSRRAA